MPREDRDYRSGRDEDDRWRRGGGSLAGNAGGGDEGSSRSPARDDRDDRDDDGDRDVLGRRRGGWFGDPERHAEISRRSFESHARAFGLPENGGGGSRSRTSEGGGYRSRGDDQDRGYGMR